MDISQIKNAAEEFAKKLDTNGDNVTNRSSFNDKIGNKIFATILERDEFSASLRDTCIVVDASSDPNVESGWALYKYYNLGTGNEWVMIAKEAGMADMSGEAIRDALEGLEGTERLSADSIKSTANFSIISAEDRTKYTNTANRAMYSMAIYNGILSEDLIDVDMTFTTDLKIIIRPDDSIVEPLIFVNTDYYPVSKVALENVGGNLSIIFKHSLKPYVIKGSWTIHVHYPVLVKDL